MRTTIDWNTAYPAAGHKAMLIVILLLLQTVSSSSAAPLDNNLDVDVPTLQSRVIQLRALLKVQNHACNFLGWNQPGSGTPTLSQGIRMLAGLLPGANAPAFTVPCRSE